MSLTIRMSRGGAKKRPFYRIVVADSRSPRDGRFIERLGTYNPMVPKDHPERVTLNTERIKHWLGAGAQPSDRVARFLGANDLVPAREVPTQTKKNQPRKRAQERLAAEAEARAKAAAAAAAAPGRRGTRPRRHPPRRHRPPRHRPRRSRTARDDHVDAGGAQVCVGAVVGAHGVKGIVRIRSYTAEPADVASYGPVTDEAGRSYALAVVGMARGAVLARIAGIDDRDAAEALKGVRLYVPRGALPETDAEEYYHADLMGMRAELTDGTVVGTVAAIGNYGAGDVIEVARPGARSLLLPFTAEAVPEVDLAGRRIVIVPPVETGGVEGAGDER